MIHPEKYPATVKGIKKNRLLFVVDVWIKTTTTSNEMERYNAFVLALSYFLFQSNFGQWGGIETALGKPKDGLAKTNYFYFLPRHDYKVIAELNRIVKNFRLSKVVKIIKNKTPIISHVDELEKFKKQKELKWVYGRIIKQPKLMPRKK